MLQLKSDKINIDNIRDDFMVCMSKLMFIYINRGKLQRTLCREYARAEGIEDLLETYTRFSADFPIGYLSDDNLINFLIRHEEVSEDVFKRQGTNGTIYSLRSDVIESLTHIRKIEPLAELLMERSEIKSTTGYATSCLRAAIPSNDIDKYGNKLAIVPFAYDLKATDRVYTKSYNFQQLPKKYVDIITVPKDYALLWGDFAQIDLRVMTNLFFSHDTKLREYINEYTDYYEAFARRMCDISNMTFNQEEFKSHRSEYKANILSAFYGASLRTVSSTMNEATAQRLINYINSNQYYKHYCDTIDTNILAGEGFYTESYFGHRALKHPNAKDNVKKICLNAPIQSTSADIMKLFTLAVFNKVNKHFDDTGGLRLIPYLNRHDECLFMVHKSAIPFLYEFLECTKIQVDDWTPLDVEWDIGYSYKVHDEELYQQVIKQAQNIKPVLIKRTKPYHCVPYTKLLSYSTLTYNGYTYSAIYDSASNQIICVINTEQSMNLTDFVRIVEPHLTLNDFDRVIIQVPEREMQNYITSNNRDWIFTFNPQKIDAHLLKQDLTYLVSKYLVEELHLTPDMITLPATDNYTCSRNVKWITNL